MRTKFPTTFIYGLIDPRINELRYIGKSNEPERRLWDHLHTNDKTHKTNWFGNLKQDGFKPELVVLEEIYEHLWQDAEIWWIAYMKALGANLTNHGAGGEGVDATPEIRKKMSDSAIKRVKSEPPRQPWGFSGEKHHLFGKKLPAWQKAVFTMKGKTHTEESIRKMEVAQLGEKNGMFGKHHTIESNKSNSIAHTGSNSSQFGIPRSIETINKMKATKRLNKRVKLIQQIINERRVNENE
jgi:group I intron endonuclease